MKKVYLSFAAFAAFAALTFLSCGPSSRGGSAGNEYCDCNQEDGILSIGKCKKDVLSANREDLLNEEFQQAFWDAVGDCDK
ncbi:MAG: hypothetical protein WCU80_03115 [Paludibacteraceae bacterium]|nr:hypothetical protein [Prevotellaceae bacterium]